MRPLKTGAWFFRQGYEYEVQAAPVDGLQRFRVRPAGGAWREDTTSPEQLKGWANERRSDAPHIPEGWVAVSGPHPHHRRADGAELWQIIDNPSARRALCVGLWYAETADGRQTQNHIDPARAIDELGRLDPEPPDTPWKSTQPPRVECRWRNDAGEEGTATPDRHPCGGWRVLWDRLPPILNEPPIVHDTRLSGETRHHDFTKGWEWAPMEEPSPERPWLNGEPPEGVDAVEVRAMPSEADGSARRVAGGWQWLGVGWRRWQDCWQWRAKTDPEPTPDVYSADAESLADALLMAVPCPKSVRRGESKQPTASIRIDDDGWPDGAAPVRITVHVGGSRAGLEYVHPDEHAKAQADVAKLQAYNDALKGEVDGLRRGAERLESERDDARAGLGTLQEELAAMLDHRDEVLLLRKAEAGWRSWGRRLTRLGPGVTDAGLRERLDALRGPGVHPDLYASMKVESIKRGDRLDAWRQRAIDVLGYGTFERWGGDDAGLWRRLFQKMANDSSTAVRVMLALSMDIAPKQSLMATLQHFDLTAKSAREAIEHGDKVHAAGVKEGVARGRRLEHEEAKWARALAQKQLEVEARQNGRQHGLDGFDVCGVDYYRDDQCTRLAFEDGHAEAKLAIKEGRAARAVGQSQRNCPPGEGWWERCWEHGWQEEDEAREDSEAKRQEAIKVAASVIQSAEDIRRFGRELRGDKASDGGAT